MHNHPVLALVVLLSVVGLAVGPLLVALHRGRAVPAAAVEGLTLGVVPVLVVLRLLPHAMEHLGGYAVALFAAGFVALWLADRRGHHRGAQVGRWVIVPTLALHALTDGAGLALAAASMHGAGSAGQLLAVSLVLHRVPEGLFLASVLVPTLGWRRAMVQLGYVVLATVLGAAGGNAVLAHVPDAWFDGAVALGLGAMLRLVLHSHVPAPRARVERLASATAFALGLLLALSIPAPDSVLRRAQPRELSVVQSLGPLFVETAPAMLAGLLAAALVSMALPRRTAPWLRAGATTRAQALRGLVFGVPLPVCACGVPPVVRSLLEGGAPAAGIAAFALGTPALSLDAVFLSARLLGVPLTLVRLVASVALALGVALLVARVAPRFRLRAGGARPRKLTVSAPVPSDPPPAPSTGSPPLAARLRAALGDAFGPGLDHVAGWYLAGLLLAALAEAAIAPGALAALGSPWDVFAGALLALPAYVCAQGATPLAAVLVHKGFSVGAALTFLVVGPSTNAAVLLALRRSLGVRAATVFALGSAAAAIGAGVAVNALVPARSVPAMHPMVAHQHWPVEWLLAALLAALLLISLGRLGPRAWFANMSSGAPLDQGSHAH